jgi:hypothetical protein
MLDRIENTRRLAEQCERRTRMLRSKGEHHSAGQMERQAISLRWEMQGLEAEAALEAFTSRVEG